MYDLDYLDSYTVVTESGTKGTVAWGGPIPAVTPQLRRGNANRVYSNGMDAWYYRSNRT